MICPKCGRPAEPTSVICPSCDYILDPSFLWEEDDEHQIPPADATQEIPALTEATAHKLGSQPANLASAEHATPDRAAEASREELMDWLMEATFEASAHEQNPFDAHNEDKNEASASDDPELANWLLEPSLEEAQLPQPGALRPHRPDGSPFDGQTDAILLGDLQEEYEVVVTQEANWFLTAATDDIERPVQSVPLYLSKSVREMLRPEAVLACEPHVDAALTPFEEHILQFLNGRRPLGRVAVLCELGQQDLEIAVSMLSEKRVIRLVGQAKEGSAAPAASNMPEPPPAIEPEPSAPSEPEPPPAIGPLPTASNMPEAAKASAPQPHAEAAPTPRPRPAASRLAGPTLRQKQVAKPLLHGKKAGPAGAPADGASPVRPQTPPKNTRIETGLFEKARVEEESGNHEEAIQLLRRCIQEQPHVAGFHNRLGVLLAARMKDYHEAIVHLTRATELQPDNPTYRNNLGKIIAAAAAADGDDRPAKPASPGGFWSTLKKIF